MDFASQLNVSLANGWGIVRTVTDMCMKQPDGKYVLIKDPNKVSCALSGSSTSYCRSHHCSGYVGHIIAASWHTNCPPLIHGS